MDLQLCIHQVNYDDNVQMTSKKYQKMIPSHKVHRWCINDNNVNIDGEVKTKNKNKTESLVTQHVLESTTAD